MRKITPIEKWTIIMLGSAAAYKVLLWQLGYQVDSQGPIWWGVLDILAVLRVVFALIGFVGFDLAIYALIADARSHGATAGAALVLLTAAVVSILIALDAASDCPMLTLPIAAWNRLSLAMQAFTTAEKIGNDWWIANRGGWEIGGLHEGEYASGDTLAAVLLKLSKRMQAGEP